MHIYILFKDKEVDNTAWKKKLTLQQKDDYKAEKREEMRNLFKKIDDGVKAVFESERYKECLRYDCGSCLLPQADEHTMRLVLQNPDEMNARIFHFPTSAIKYDGQKINYRQFLMSGKYDACNRESNFLLHRLP